MDGAYLRRVRQLEPNENEIRNNRLSTFNEYFHKPNIILLGDPGLGKTYTFQSSAVEENAKFLTVRQFLATNGEDCEGCTIYLDGLDEYRSRVDDKNLVLSVTQLLIKINRPKLRLSCRVADWLGETDLSIFRQYFKDSDWAVLELLSLDEDEAGEILAVEGIQQPSDFIRTAEQKGVKSFLKNPQTLIMLSSVVKSGDWPETKTELYEKSTEILLSEHNEEHLTPGLGKYSSEELLDSSGAACATMLISGVEGISLLETSTELDFPSYRTVPFENLEMVQSCLTRKAFSIVESKYQSVSYSHRTIAEYLSAKWISKKIRNGYPIKRIIGLIGIEGYPAPELRGLNAWLATLLHEHSESLIENDPYGVIIYGDPAFLPILSRQSLIYALEKFSKVDPWFRAEDWSGTSLGALSGIGMIDIFKRILSNSDANYHLRSVVLDAITYGPNLPQIKDELLNILKSSDSGEMERLSALKALQSSVPDSEQEIASLYKTHLINDKSSFDIKSKILSTMYENYFEPEDVISLCEETLEDTKYVKVHNAWQISETLPLKSLAEILDGICGFLGERISGKKVLDVEMIFSKIIDRLLDSYELIQPERLLVWLKSLHKLRYRHGSGYTKDNVKGWLSDNNEILKELFNLTCQEINDDTTPWIFHSNFLQLTCNAISQKTLIDWSFEKFPDKDKFLSNDYCLYESLGYLLLHMSSPDMNKINVYLEYADGDSHLEEIRNRVFTCNIEDWRREDKKREKRQQLELEQRRNENKENLNLTKETIITGQHLGNLDWLANVYFGNFYDLDRELKPKERLKIEIGEELLEDALVGFNAVLKKEDLPSPAHIANLHVSQKRFSLCYVILAGMDEAYIKNKNLTQFSNNLLRTALAISYVNHTYEYTGNTSTETLRGWVHEANIHYPNLVSSVISEMSIVMLEAKQEHIPVIYSLVSDNRTLPWRGELSFDLLYRFPSAPYNSLKYLIEAVLSDNSKHKKLLELAKSVINTRGKVIKEKRAVWLVVGYLLDEELFELKLTKYSTNHDGVTWEIKDFVDFISKEEKIDIEFTNRQLSLIIKLIGSKYVNTPYPSGGWSGNKNPWDASRFVINIIDLLSTRTGEDPSRLLKALLKIPKLASYRDHIKHVNVKQSSLNREVLYIQPNWSQVSETLQNGKPVNNADLFALVLDHLIDIKRGISNSNTDTYKMFWSCDSYARVKEPEVEDICRDRLLELLRNALNSINVRAEPEAHMADDKRADICVFSSNYKLPIEVKRDSHSDVWSACQNQLERLYNRDPEAGGYGLYVVFWFGEKRKGAIPTAPNNIARPKSVEEFEISLRSLIPLENRHCIDVLVIDVTPSNKN